MATVDAVHRCTYTEKPCLITKDKAPSVMTQIGNVSSPCNNGNTKGYIAFTPNSKTQNKIWNQDCCMEVWAHSAVLGPLMALRS